MLRGLMPSLAMPDPSTHPRIKLFRRSSQTQMCRFDISLPGVSDQCYCGWGISLGLVINGVVLLVE